MLDDRQRAKLAHPARGILRRAAATGQIPDPAELAELGLDDTLTGQVREAAEIVADLGGTGLHNRGRARRLAEELGDSIAEATPRGRRGSLPPVDPHADDDPHELAEAIERRRREHVAETLDTDDRDAIRTAAREARQARRG